MLKKIRYATVITAIATVPLAALAVRDYLLLSGLPQRAPSQTLTPPVQQAARPLLRSYAPIVEKSVFPSATRQFSPMEFIESVEADAVSSALSGLKLIGLYSGPESFAIFEKPGGAQGVFRKGEPVFDAGTLKDVTPLKAVVTSGLKDVSFSINRKKEGDGPLMETAAEEPPHANGTLTKQVGENSWVVNQDAMVNTIDNIGQVLSDARMTPRLSDGSVVGFMVTEIKPKGVFDRIGLKNGDILTRVNGYEIDTPEKAVQVISGLKGESRLEIDIIRNGVTKNLKYEIK